MLFSLLSASISGIIDPVGQAKIDNQESGLVTDNEEKEELVAKSLEGPDHAESMKQLRWTIAAIVILIAVAFFSR